MSKITHNKFVLKNGFPVITVPLKESASLTILVIYKVGSRYENLKINHGVSHFIEHLMFKGTKKRPTTLDISKILDGIGAEFNAYTAKDHTGYYIKTDAEKTELACDVLSDMLNNSLFDKKEMEMEKGVIIEELKMYQDQPIQYAEMLFEELIFKGNNLGEDIGGTVKSVTQMKRKDLLNYYEQFYIPCNGVIVISGKINKNLKNTLSKKFVHGNVNKKMNCEQVQIPKFKEFKNNQKEPRILLHYKNTKQVHLAMGFPAYSYSHPDLYALHLLSIILGGNMSSRLFINIREKRGLCYYIRAQADIYQDTGNLMIRSGLDTKQIHQAVKLIVAELRKIKNQGITDKELKMAKDYLKGRTTLSMESSNFLAEHYARQFILTDKIDSPEIKLKKIFRVTRTQVNKVAKDIIKDNKINLAMIGPYKNKKKFLDLLKF